MSAAITCILIGSTLIAFASIGRDLSRVPALLRRLEEDRQRLENVTHYTGPAYTRRGRQIEGN